MICPEGSQIESEANIKEDEGNKNKKTKQRKVPAEGNDSMELHSYKSPRTWKKSITNFFRNQLRSTKSNDGDPASSNENFEDKEMCPEQKWQSLGKMFRRQSFGDTWNKPQNQQGEGGSSQSNKRLAVRKVISSYFGKKAANEEK